jgi:hypothetical protein
LGFNEDIALRDLLEVMGESAPPALRAASRQLQDTARTLASEVAINRQALRHSLASGDAYVRALGNSGAPRLGYGETLGTPDTAKQPQFLNRRI